LLYFAVYKLYSTCGLGDSNVIVFFKAQRDKNPRKKKKKEREREKKKNENNIF
jgi:hypothetical protein